MSAAQRLGESHHNAVLTNREVDLLFAMHAQGFSYRLLALKFEVGKSCVAKILTGQRRAHNGVPLSAVSIPREQP